MQSSLNVQLPQLRFQHYLALVALRTIEEGGITSHPVTYTFLEPIDAWGFPQYPSKTVIVSPSSILLDAIQAFIEQNMPYFLKPKVWFGTWIHPQTNACYLDITMSHENLDTARRLAQEASAQEGRKIVALYNSLRQQTIYL